MSGANTGGMKSQRGCRCGIAGDMNVMHAEGFERHSLRGFEQRL
jgi:hypothetical protein